MGLGFRVQGLGLGFRKGCWLRLGFRVQDLGFKVEGGVLGGFRV